jgi:hypothetical protein
MTAPNLIAIVGGGGVLALGGFIVLGAAGGVILAATVPTVNLGIWLLIIGGVMLVLGLMLVERGGAKTVEKVGNELSMPNVVSNFPWTFAVAGAAGTLFFVWLFRRRSPIEVAKDEGKTVFIPPTPIPTPPLTPPPAPKRTTLSDVMMPLGAAAAQYAATTAMKALGVPTPQEMLMSAVKGIFRGSEDGKPNADRLRKEAPHNGYEAAMQRT